VKPWSSLRKSLPLLHNPVTTLEIACPAFEAKGSSMTNSNQPITLQAQCLACNKTVTAYPLVNKDDLVVALKHKLDVRVMHVTPEKDHIWSLNLEEKQTLSNAIYQRFGLRSF
jgi:hypothetical protein